MKTTIEISDSLLEEAKRLAAKEGTTVRAYVEQGLRRILTERKSRGVFRLRKRLSRAQEFSPGFRMQPGNESGKRFTREGADDRCRYEFACLRSSRGLTVA